jgi:PERQ amino acid-rich with GYF domain-containing protein
MDGRHFAEEFVRRKRLAEKGVVEKQPLSTDTKSASTSSGWSEVAKKSSSTVQAAKENDTSVQAAGFKVVPSRKKGKK